MPLVFAAVEDDDSVAALGQGLDNPRADATLSTSNEISFCHVLFPLLWERVRERVYYVLLTPSPRPSPKVERKFAISSRLRLLLYSIKLSCILRKDAIAI